jgi:lysophospholipase L1-like esterase
MALLQPTILDATIPLLPVLQVGATAQTPNAVSGDALAIPTLAIGTGVQTGAVISGDIVPLPLLQAAFAVLLPAITDISEFSPTDVTQATAGKRPLLYLTTVNGYAIRALRFDGIDDVLAKVDFELAQPNTVFVVGKTRPYGKVNQMIIGSTAAGLNNLYQYDGITMVYAGNVLVRTGNDDDWCVFRATFNGAASVLGIDDRTETINPGTLTRVGLGIGAKPNSTTPLALDVCEVLLYDTALSDGDVADIIAYFRSRHNVLWPLSGRQLICDGDSLTQGLGLADMVTQSYPAQLSNLHPSQARVRNFGYWGQRLTTMAADAAVQIDTLYGGGYTKNCCVIWGGTNDIVVDGVTPANAYIRLKAYVNARKAVGWLVIVITMTPRWGYDEAKRQTFNNLIRDGYATSDLNCDMVADVEDDDLIGAEDAHLGPCYQVDQTHLNLAGQTILTGIVDAALNRLTFWEITARRPWQQRRHRRMVTAA